MMEKKIYLKRKEEINRTLFDKTRLFTLFTTDFNFKFVHWFSINIITKKLKMIQIIKLQIFI